MMRWWWLGAVSLSLAQVSFHVGPEAIAINEYVKFQVIVAGQGREVPHFPQGLTGEDFRLIRTSPDRQSSMTMVNGKISQKMIYTYYLKPNRKGPLTLPVQTINLSGRAYTSPAFNIQVGDESRSLGQHRQRTDPFEDLFGRRDRSRQQRTVSAEIFVEAQVPKDTYYLGEPIPYSVVIYRSPGVEISNSGSSMDLPKFDHFWSEEIATRQEPKRVRRENKILEMITIDKRQLFASKPGRLTIPAASLKLTVALGRGFFADWQTVNRNTKPVEINIKPLPEVGKPAEFSGAVGRFAVHGELDKAEIAVGDSVSLKVVVTGTGNYNAISELKLPDLDRNFEIFDGGAPTVEKKDGIVKSKSWIFALVPKREGQFEIPVPKIGYFSLDSNTYRTTQPQVFTLKVEGGEGLVAAGPVGGERGLLLASQNLNFIMQGPLGGQNMGQRLLSPRPLFWVAGLLLLLNLSIIATRTISRQLQGNLAQSRPKFALRHCFKKIDQLAVEQDDEIFHAGLAQAIFAYFGDKWQRPGQGISLEDIQDFFNRKALDTSLAQDVVSLVETCEQARFTPTSPGSRDQIINNTRGVLNQIDEVMA